MSRFNRPDAPTACVSSRGTVLVVRVTLHGPVGFVPRMLDHPPTTQATFKSAGMVRCFGRASSATRNLELTNPDGDVRQDECNVRAHDSQEPTKKN